MMGPEEIKDNTDGGSAGTSEQEPPKTKKSKFSGDYWYVDTDGEELKTRSLYRSLLCILALMFQCAALAVPQAGLGYVTENIKSYAQIYLWAVLIMLGVSIYVIVMNIVRYKIDKRIPVEYAPKNGFKTFVYLGMEIFIAVNAIVFAIQFSFVCIFYDGWGLAAMFSTFLATASAVGARILTHLTLRSAVLVKCGGAPADAEQGGENE